MDADAFFVLFRVVLFTFLGAMHGTSKAFRDTIDHHWGRSIFALVKTQWLYVWLRSDWTEKPEHGWRSKIPPLWDGWHFGDFLTGLSPISAAFYGLYAGLDAGLMVFYVFSAMVAFHFCYHRWFLVDGVD